VKHSVNVTNLQLNLLHLDDPAGVLPNDKQQELILALAEMLANAAREGASHLVSGGNDESETDK
jgi:anti-sigma regulatory factor (Ser/Thr protein kinase)